MSQKFHSDPSFRFNNLFKMKLNKMAKSYPTKSKLKQKRKKKRHTSLQLWMENLFSNRAGNLKFLFFKLECLPKYAI